MINLADLQCNADLEQHKHFCIRWRTNV